MMPDTCKNPGNCDVILVEDDPTLKLVMGMQLKSEDINFCSCSDGYTALELIRSHHPRVLLLDVSLPGMSGFELVEKLRQDPELSHLTDMHLIVHTSHDLSENDMKLLSFGQIQFLTKSKLADELPVIVKKLLY